MSYKFIMTTQKQLKSSVNNNTPNELSLDHEHPINNEQFAEEFQEYFKSIKKEKKNNSYAEELQNIAQDEIKGQITRGDIVISEDQKDLDEMLLQKLVNAEEEKINNDKVKKKLLEAQMAYLKSQLTVHQKSKVREDDEFQEDLQNMDHYAVLSKDEHKQFLSRITKQRESHDKKRKKLMEERKQKQLEEQKKQKEAEAERLAKEKEEKIKKLIQKKEEYRIEKQKKAKEEEQSKKKLREVHEKKLLYKIIEEKYQSEVLIPSLEEKKKKLKEIREFNRSFNPAELRNHEEEYLRKREQSLENSLARVKHEEWNYKAPEKSQRLARILEKERLEKKIKQTAKKRELQQKKHKREEFLNVLKEFKPKIDEKKREENERMKKNRSSQSKERPDGKILGMNYLEEAKNMRKKSAHSQLHISHRDSELKGNSKVENKKALTNYLDSSKSIKEYNMIRQQRIDRLIHSETEGRFQKIQQLQVEANKLSEQQKRMEEKKKLSKGEREGEEEAESIGLLMASIKAKMGIIDAFNKD